MLPRRLAGRLAALLALLLTGCIAGAPSGTQSPGDRPERITVLAVTAAAAPVGGAGPAVLLTFRVRNDAAMTADFIRVYVRAFQADTQVGYAVGPAPGSLDVRLRVGQEAVIPVRVVGPAAPDALDCYAYWIDVAIGGGVGSTRPVRRCLQQPTTALTGG